MKALLALGLVAALLPLAAPSGAQNFPVRPLRLIVPFAPGGAFDVSARLISAPVAQSIGQNVVVDNRPGSGGLIATQDAARAQSDGYTMLMSSGAQLAISPALRPNLAYDPIKSFTHVIHMTDMPMVLVAHPALPVANAKELIAYSLANRGKLNTASTGIGTYTHMTLELFKQRTGADLTHVPYKGAAPAINDLLGRQVETLFTSTASAQPHVAAKRLKTLGIAAPKRAPALPEAPTLAELGISGVEVSSWTGISMPAGVPPAIVNQLAAAFAGALERPDVRERLATLGSDVANVRGEAFTRMVRDDVARWAKVVKAANIKLD